MSLSKLERKTGAVNYRSTPSSYSTLSSDSRNYKWAFFNISAPQNGEWVVWDAAYRIIKRYDYRWVCDVFNIPMRIDFEFVFWLQLGYFYSTYSIPLGD